MVVEPKMALPSPRLCWIVPLLCCASIASAASLDDAKALYLSGDYAKAEELANEQVERGIWNERWPRLLIQCQLVQGKYQEAKTTFENAIRRYPTSLTLRMLGLEAVRFSNLPDEVKAAESQILRLMQTSPTRYSSRDNLVAAGRYFQSQREDARRILEFFYDRVRDADPEHLEAYIATAELAIEKGDFKVAAETLARAAEFDDTDPRLAFLTAKAWESSDSEKATAALVRALELNPKHIPSLLYQADAAIDREQYEDAEKLIREVMEINPHQADAWALLAVLAHLRGDYENEVLLRQTALSTWAENPHVDHLIGLKLSQKYRFEEGAKYQRRALEFDPEYVPASFQLAQDLLRLGHDEVGWMIAQTVADQDRYNVVAHNLMTLYDRLKDFRILERDGIQVRMDPREAAIYGDAVLELLSEAKRVLCPKYEVEPRAPIVVEIFPEQKDFAIRTFGLPGGAGFLGVCFGRVITANSPASQGESPSNWRSVLWHEFCHVVTLEKTKNRMPRWLSEGISVYEERQRDASWGESMTPIYREMLLSEDLTPVSDLSAAFLSPPSPVHLQFAYYQSSLVIEFLIEQHGLDALKLILSDLGDGLTINDALIRSVGSLDKLDSQFAEYAREHAEQFGADVDWSREELPEEPSTLELMAWVKQHPNNYWGLRQLGQKLVAEEKYDQARETLEKLQTLEAITGQSGGPLEQLAAVYRELDETEAEQRTLEKIVSLSSDSLPALRRLIEMERAAENWDQIEQYALKFTSINPLLSEGQLAMAEAAERLDRPEQVVQALSALKQLDPVDPAELDFRMAGALAKLDQIEKAKYHVLRALDEAPRYRDAHRLLLALNEPKEKPQDEPRPKQDPEPKGDSEPKPTDEAGSKPKSEPEKSAEESPADKLKTESEASKQVESPTEATELPEAEQPEANDPSTDESPKQETTDE